jgi:hypothetical protein
MEHNSKTFPHFPQPLLRNVIRILHSGYVFLALSHAILTSEIL